VVLNPIGRRRRALGPILLALFISLLVFWIVARQRTRIQEVATYGYLGAFIVGFLGNATVILPVPSLGVTFALGSALNPFLLAIVVGLGEALGELTGYLTGVGGKVIVEDRQRYAQARELVHRYGWRILLVLAAIPNPFFDVAGIVAGATRYPMWKFLLACWVGKAIKAFFFAGIGRQLLR